MVDSNDSSSGESTIPKSIRPTVLIPRGAGERFLLILACAMIVLAGLKEISGVLQPIFLAALLSSACVGPLEAMRRWGLPKSVAIVLILTLAGGLLLITSVYVGASLKQFTDSHIFEPASERVSELFTKHFAPSEDPLLTTQMASLIIQTGGSLLSAISNSLIVLLLMFFMLLEADRLPGRVARAFSLPEGETGTFGIAAEKVHEYVSLKILTSLLTGVQVFLLCVFMGLSFAPLWALIAFLFNFVPNIGSIIAGIPVVTLALVQSELGAEFDLHWGRAGVAAAGMAFINLWVGNLLEPRLMGSRLGLSSLVIFASLMLWGWVLGPVGMLIAVPITVILKLLLEHTDDMRWVAVLLGNDQVEGDPPVGDPGEEDTAQD